jgi:hypothetical protein
VFVRKSIVVLIMGLVATLSGSVVALAANQFTDVADSNVFHDDIAWLADLGITKGCNPPTNDRFCPGDNVTRGQMAAFLHRLGETRIEHTIAIDQIGFLPLVDARDYLDYDYNAVGTLGRTSTAPLGASVPVPDGATITGFSITVCDANAVIDSTAVLLRRPDPAISGAYAETVAEVTSTGDGCAITVSTTDIENAVVDTSTYSYAVEVRSSGGGSGLVRRATVTYELPLIP